MNNVISKCFIIIIFFVHTIYGMNKKRAVIAQCIYDAAIPVLSINDYIVDVPNAYQALIKEVLLYGAFFLKRENFNVSYSPPKNNSNTCMMLVYGRPHHENRIPQQLHCSPNYTMLNEHDFERIRNIPEEASVCIANLFCGVGMLGVLLLLTFCR